jgi:hypothetical protein
MNFVAVVLLALGATAAPDTECLNKGGRNAVRLSIPGGGIARKCTGSIQPAFVGCSEWKQCSQIYDLEKFDVSGALDWSTVPGIKAGRDPIISFSQVCCEMDGAERRTADRRPRAVVKVPQRMIKPEDWTMYENMQCAFEEDDGSLNEDPNFRSKRTIPLEACMEHCMMSTDIHGRPCVAIEMKRDAGAHKRVQCRLAWSCDIQTANEHLDTYVMPKAAPKRRRRLQDRLEKLL